MKTVLTRPKNALCKQYKQLFKASDTEFKITPEALQEIAIAACKRKSGARGLRSILEQLLQDALFEVSSNLTALYLTIAQERRISECMTAYQCTLCFSSPRDTMMKV